MKLIIKPDEMQIVTESVQDVAYLKNMGYYSYDKDIQLKVSVFKTWDDSAVSYDKEGVEINICWESKNLGHSSSGDDSKTREVVQRVSGPRTDLKCSCIESK